MIKNINTLSNNLNDDDLKRYSLKLTSTIVFVIILLTWRWHQSSKLLQIIFLFIPEIFFLWKLSGNRNEMRLGKVCWSDWLQFSEFINLICVKVAKNNFGRRIVVLFGYLLSEKKINILIFSILTSGSSFPRGRMHRYSSQKKENHWK